MGAALGKLAASVTGVVRAGLSAMKSAIAPVGKAAAPLTRPLGAAWGKLPLPVALAVMVAVSVVALQGSPSSDLVAAAEASELLGAAQADSAMARERLAGLVVQLEAAYPEPESHGGGDAGHGGGAQEQEHGAPEADHGGGGEHGGGGTSEGHGEGSAGGEDGHGGGEDHDKGADWSYKDPTGPSRWVRLSHEFEACGEPEGQSPVDLKSADAVKRPLSANVPSLRAGRATVSIENHRVVATGDFGGATLNGVPYRAERVVVHTPAEHSVDGFTADAEVQVEMSSASGGEAVLAFQVVSGSDHPAGAALAGASAQASAGPVTAGVIDVASLMPASASAFRYVGSSTAPPCHGGVTWTLMATPIQFGPAQLSTLKSVTGPNARPQAPLGGRTVVGGQLVP